jgi:hypothetical protein
VNETPAVELTECARQGDCESEKAPNLHGLAGKAIERLTPGVVDNQHHPSPVANEFHWSQSPFSVQVLPKFALMCETVDALRDRMPVIGKDG